MSEIHLQSSETMNCYAWIQNWMNIQRIENCHYLYLLVSLAALKRKWKMQVISVGQVKQLCTNRELHGNISVNIQQIIMIVKSTVRDEEKTFVILYRTQQSTRPMYLDLYCGNPVVDEFQAFVTFTRTPPEPLQMTGKMTCSLNNMEQRPCTLHQGEQGMGEEVIAPSTPSPFPSQELQGT